MRRVQVLDLQGGDFAPAQAGGNHREHERLIMLVRRVEQCLELVAVEVDVVLLEASGQAHADAGVRGHVSGLDGSFARIGHEGVAVADGLAGVAAFDVHPVDPRFDAVAFEGVEGDAVEAWLEVAGEVGQVSVAGARGDAGQVLDVVAYPGNNAPRVGGGVGVLNVVEREVGPRASMSLMNCSAASTEVKDSAVFLPW